MKELELEFTGIGEVKGDIFKQINRSPYAYIYERDYEGIKSYEVFLRKEIKESNTIIGGVEVHFEARVKYPRAEDFGVWAWYYNSYDKAINKYDNINKFMVFYKDKTWCHFKECVNFTTCKRALTNEVRALAEDWMPNAPIAQFTDKPDCYEENRVESGGLSEGQA